MPPQTLTQGQTFTDTSGNQGVAQFNQNTGQRLSAGQSVTTLPRPNITPAPVTPSTTIPTSSLTNTNQFNLPSAQPSSGALPAASNIGTVASLNQQQQSLLGTTNANEQSAQDNYNTQLGNTQSLINSYLGEGADEANQMQQNGVYQLQQTSNNLTNQYNTAEQAYNAQYDQIINRPGSTLEDSADQIAALQQQRGYAMTNLGVQQSVAQNNYNTALQLVQNQIQIKYAPLKDAITYQESILQNAQGILTAQQTNQFQANLQVQQQQYTQSTYYSNLNATTGMDMLKEAQANGADSATIQAMSTAITNGGSISDIAGAAGNYLQSGNYSMQYNPNTGQMEPLNTNTGLFKDGSSGTGPVVTAGTDQNGTSNTNIVSAPNGTAYNFNASGYNTADSNYGVKLSTAVQGIQTKYGTITSASQAQSVINDIAPGSQVTGQMVMTAAQNAGIDPSVLIAQMKEESLCGTSNVGTADNNCGGIAWAGQANATKGTARPASEGGNYAHFNTVQDGVNAQAVLIAKAKIPPSPTTTGQTATTQYSLQNYTALKTSLPTNLQPGMGYMTQTGDAYVVPSRATDLPGAPPGTAATKLEQFASAHGIPVLTEDQAQAMSDADTALTQINNLQSAWNAVAPTSAINAGNPLTTAANWWDTTTHNQQGNLITKYLSMDTSGLDVLNSITGSKRLSTFSASLAASALPTLGGLQAGDSLESGNQKLDDLRQEIAASITPIIPTSKGAPLSGEINTSQAQASPEQISYGGKIWVKQSDGNYLPQ